MYLWINGLMLLPSSDGKPHMGMDSISSVYCITTVAPAHRNLQRGGAVDIC